VLQLRRTLTSSGVPVFLQGEAFPGLARTYLDFAMERRRLELLHTADLHIGDDSTPWWVANRLKALATVIDTAIAQKVDALLVAGDFFDNARIRYEDVNDALEQLARLTIPVIVTPGNHDCLGAPSIYERVRLLDAGPHVHFLDEPEGSHAVLDELGLTVWARGMVVHNDRNFPLSGYEPLHEENWQVAMAHGYYMPDGRPSSNSSQMPQSQLNAMSCDFLALGHWHRFARVGETIPAYYAGSPSEPGGSFASVNLVTLDPLDGVSVRRLATQPDPERD
jgi:DNA repair exonuclease SbcCD nuclease subunit